MNAPKSLDHIELVSLAASGDLQAQRALVARLQPRVRTIALAVLGNRLDAEDASQSIMIEILGSAASYRGENLLAWSDRISIRTAMRHARQRRVRATHCDPAPDVEEIGARAPERVPSHEIPRPLVEYLAELPEARRVALVLRHVMDYSVEEIAALTSASPNTVKDRLLHARQQMRRSIRRDLAILGVRPGAGKS